MGSARNQPRNAATVVTQDIYKESDVQLHDLGTFFDLPDGRRFRYCQAGGALTGGMHTVRPASVAYNHSIVVATAAAGSPTLTVTLGGAAVTANQYAGGYIALIAGTGAGQIYRIKSHPAQATTTGTVVLTLYDPLITATLASDTKGDLAVGRYSGLTNSATEELLHVGVPLISITSAYYHWEQTKGICLCLTGTSDTSAEGTMLSAGGQAGAVKTMADLVKDFVGISVGQARAQTEYNFIDLRLE